MDFVTSRLLDIPEDVRRPDDFAEVISPFDNAIRLRLNRKLHLHALDLRDDLASRNARATLALQQAQRARHVGLDRRQAMSRVCSRQLIVTCGAVYSSGACNITTMPPSQ